MSDTIFSRNNFILDTSTSTAFGEIIESNWDFNVFCVSRTYIIKCTGVDIFDYFISKYKDLKYKIFYGRVAYLWNDKFSIKFSEEFYPIKTAINPRFNDEITISGNRKDVLAILADFDEHFEKLIVPEHHIVNMIVKSSHGGLDKISLPVKTDRKFYPELYPCIKDPNKFISDFLSSSANVLILTGPAGLGKSALINEIILKAAIPTEIVFDIDVMRTDTLYTNFINRSLSDDGGLMIMEDADLILSDRQTAANDMMSRLLNLSDGIVNTSGAKFIFSANLKSKAEIDDALVRPGRCFDVVEFRNLSYEEAVVATKAIGVDLYTEKDEYTIAELFNSTDNRKEKKRRVGFI